MLLFRDFLEQFGFPLPLVSAIVSVYAQFICGIMIIIGWKIRIASLLMIINFLIALLVVDRHGSFETMTPALAILFSAVVFLFQGAGRYSVDKE
jgi:putative oxidoreductase